MVIVMDINRIFGLDPVLRNLKAKLVNFMLLRPLGIGETLTIDTSFVFEQEVFNMTICIIKVEEPEDSHFEVGGCDRFG